MKNVKYEIGDVSLYDYQYIEQHLAEMSAKGWHLEQMTNFYWKYRRDEGKEVRYAATYAPKASIYNSRPTESEEDLAQLCADAGWVRIATLAQLQIFRNDDPNAVPLETDEHQRFAAMRKSMLRHYIPAQTVLILLFLFMLYTQFDTLLRYPCESLSMPLLFCGIGMSLTIIVLYTVQLCACMLWMHRAKEAVEAGLPCPTDRFYRKFRFVLWIAIAVFLLALLCSAEPRLALRVILTAVLNIGVIYGLISLCKSLGAPRWVNILVPVLGGSLILMLATPAVLGILGTAVPEPERELPLLLSDLMEIRETDRLVIEEQSSPAVSHGRYVDTCFEEDIRLQYTIVDVKWDMFYDLCLNEQEQLYLRTAEHLTDNLNHNAPWNAEYVRQCVDSDGEQWLICWDDRIVLLYTSWELTEAQIEQAREVLMP